MLRHLIFFLLITIPAIAGAQPLSFVFERVTTEQGLSTGGVASIGQDKYGYVWIGTNNGLNRFDGYNVKVYEHIHGDSTSVLPSQARSILNDSEGRLWVGFLHGLMEYDFTNDRFVQYHKNRISGVNEVVETGPHQLHIATGRGLFKLNTANGDVVEYGKEPYKSPLLGTRIRDLVRFRDTLLILSEKGLILFNIQTEKSVQVQLPAGIEPERLSRIAANPATGEVWLAYATIPDKIFRTNIFFRDVKTYTDLTFAVSGLPNAVTDMMIDRSGRLWVASAINGIALFDENSGKFRSAVNNPFLPNSIVSNNIYRIFEDRQGYMWLGSSAAGAIYFHPQYTFFQTILPVNKYTGADELWARAAVESADGALWLGTGMGLVKYDRASGESQFFQNIGTQKPVLYSNSIRSLCEDRDGNLWIGTATGINLKRKGSDKFEFLKPDDGFYAGFTLAIKQTKDGTIWIGTSGDGHYYVPPGSKKAFSISNHPVLKPFTGMYGHVITEDSRGLLWLGLDGRGLICYDPHLHTARHWEYSATNDSTVAGNYVYSIAEAPDGKVWVSTSSGLSCIDPVTFRFTNYDRARGLHTNRITTMNIDRHNRLWAGTSQGLMLFDSTRTHSRLFNVRDGLPVNEFSDMPPYTMRDGSFLFPSRRGFLLFNPEKYQPFSPDMKAMLSKVKVFDHIFQAGANFEELHEFELPPGQNYFSLEMTALNYRNPRQTWYAYKLEPYDKNWTYTQDRTAVYTNVPGGNYVFRFKASSDHDNWNVEEQKIAVKIQVHWYESAWFWGLIILVAAAGGLLEYRRRSQYKRRLNLLERKAQMLAKEKALVQYENLTQQLNPHFLFNSLASLGSLIRIDAKKASEFLESLSKMYRYVLRSPERATVTLREEIDFAQHFILLNTTRFDEALQVKMEINPDCMSKRVAPVTLQNLMENAIKHNTLDSESPLIIRIFDEGPWLVMQNNLQRRQVVDTSNKQGLQRLRLLYSYMTDIPMEIIETDTSFIVKVPLLKE